MLIEITTQPLNNGHMQFFTIQETVVISAKSCDRCLFHAEKDDPEFHEFLSIDRRVGFSSIFGDGNHLKLDLCQHCMKELLNPWLSASKPDSF
ncbi:hypothetical protein OW293_022990 [Providencia rettgeri]|nr:hypothetical protein [Providencia rettgeri]